MIIPLSESIWHLMRLRLIQKLITDYLILVPIQILIGNIDATVVVDQAGVGFSPPDTCSIGNAYNISGDSKCVLLIKMLSTNIGSQPVSGCNLTCMNGWHS